VAERKLKTFDRYRYGKRSFLYPGDTFRASGGPYYLSTDDRGKRVRIPMNETGVFTFIRYCELGASRWIEARHDKHGTAIIYVGRARRSPRLASLRLRPHKIRFVPTRAGKKRAVVMQPTAVQRTLF